MGINFGRPKLLFVALFFSVIPIILSSCFSYRTLNTTQSGGEFEASDFEIGQTYRITLQGVSRPLDITVHQVQDSSLSVINQHSRNDILLSSIETAQRRKFSYLKTYFLVVLGISLAMAADYSTP